MRTEMSGFLALVDAIGHLIICHSDTNETSGTKALTLGNSDGTAEAVPFPNQ